MVWPLLCSGPAVSLHRERRGFYFSCLIPGTIMLFLRRCFNPVCSIAFEAGLRVPDVRLGLFPLACHESQMLALGRPCCSIEPAWIIACLQCRSPRRWARGD